MDRIRFNDVPLSFVIMQDSVVLLVANDVPLSVVIMCLCLLL